MIFDEQEMPPKFYEDLRKENFSNEKFLKVLKLKDEFEERCPEIAIYTPDQFATHYYFFDLATKEVNRKDMLKGGAAFLISAFFAIANFQDDPNPYKWLIYVACALGMFWGGGTFITAANNPDPDMEAFFRRVKQAAENKVELDARLGTKKPHGIVPGQSSAFDVPPQD